MTNKRRTEISELQAMLKHLINARRMTLNELAGKLKISIATAKRILNSDDLSLERVLQICDLLGLKFHELVEIAAQRKNQYHLCSLEQEKFLATHPRHFAFLRALQKGMTLDEIKRKFHVTNTDCQAYLLDLEVENFLETKGDNKFRLIVSDGMDWRVEGPLWKAYFDKWVKQLTSHITEKPGDSCDYVVDISQRKLSPKSYQDMKRDLDDISRKYASISRMERELGRDELEFCSCLIIADFWTAPLWDVKPYRTLS